MTNAAATQPAPLPGLSVKMSPATAKSLLAEIYTSEQGRGEASDYAVNVLRDGAHASGLTRGQMERLLTEEVARCKAQGVKTLEGYFKAKRVGSRIRISRGARSAIFVQLVARGLV